MSLLNPIGRGLAGAALMAAGMTLALPAPASAQPTAQPTPSAVMAQSDASTLATPRFQMPFPCRQTWSGRTNADHSPANSVDFNRANDEGDTVVASAAGTVARVENLGNQSYGRWIEINHGGGWRTRYAHLSRQSVQVGQRVRAGQRIGDVGNTGGSFGAHLHFEEHLNGNDMRIVLNGSRITYFGTRNYTSHNACGR